MRRLLQTKTTIFRSMKFKTVLPTRKELITNFRFSYRRRVLYTCVQFRCARTIDCIAVDNWQKQLAVSLLPDGYKDINLWKTALCASSAYYFILLWKMCSTQTTVSALNFRIGFRVKTIFDRKIFMLLVTSGKQKLIVKINILMNWHIATAWFGRQRCLCLLLWSFVEDVELKCCNVPVSLDRAKLLQPVDVILLIPYWQNVWNFV